MAKSDKVSDISARRDVGFKVVKGKYRPEDFLIPGQDSNGNSMRLYCRVVPLLDRAVEKIVGSKKFGFHTKGDLVRWCVNEGVKVLESLEPLQPSVMAQIDAMHTIIRDETLNHGYTAVFESMSNSIGMHIQAQELGEARRMVSMIKSTIDAMGDGYWRKRYTQELDKRFGYLLHGDKVAGAGMGEMEDRTGEKFEEPDEEE